MPGKNLQVQEVCNQIEDFISAQVVGRGLDERTAMAYRMDLEHFYLWVMGEKEAQTVARPTLEAVGYEEWMETYLTYLSREKRLRFSTISRKQRVFGCYLSYLTARGVMEGYRPLTIDSCPKEPEDLTDTCLTKSEIDGFFQAMEQEYRELDSDFRRRVCLRDQVMMGLLFYHGVEISELLRMKVSDYDRKSATLTVHRKREKDRQFTVFSRTLKDEMEKWLEEHEYFEHGSMYDGRMFLSKLGKPLSMKMVINIFDKYRVKAGIQKACTPKDLKNGLRRYAEEVVREMG